MTSCLSQSAEEIVTEISMSESLQPWLVLEGTSDSLFFSTKEFSKTINTIIALGWENVVGVISKVIEESITKFVLGFIDRDYREELGIVIDEKRIVMTDYRDLEISLFESTSLQRLIVEYGSKLKLPMHDDESIDLAYIKEKVYSVALKMGKLRYFSLKEGYNFSFKELDYSKFLHPRTLVLDEEKLINHINAKNEKKITLNVLQAMFKAELPVRLVDVKNICSGHDVIEVLGIALRKMWGTNNSGDVSRCNLERSFRIGFSNEEFSKTDMYKRLSRLLESEV